MDELRLTTAQKVDSLGRETSELRNSTADAMRRADSAYQSAGDARDMALGKIGYKEVGSYTVTFNFDGDRLDNAAKANLDLAAAEIQRNPDVLVDIYGFTDQVGPDRYNLDLGQRRADTVMRYLVERTPGQLRRYAAVSFGKSTLAGKEPAGPTRRQRRQVVAALIRHIPLSEAQQSAEMAPPTKQEDRDFSTGRPLGESTTRRSSKTLKKPAQVTSPRESGGTTRDSGGTTSQDQNQNQNPNQ